MWLTLLSILKNKFVIYGAIALCAVLLMIRPPADPYTGLYIFTAFLVGAFVPKMIQKFAEQPLSMVKK